MCPTSFPLYFALCLEVLVFLESTTAWLRDRFCQLCVLIREEGKNEVGAVILPVPPWRWPQAGFDFSTKKKELVKKHPHTKYFWGPAIHPSFALWSLRKMMHLPMVSNSRIKHNHWTLSPCLLIVLLLSNTLQITQFKHTVYFTAKNLVESGMYLSRLNYKLT